MYRPEDNLTGGSPERDETILDAALEELFSGEGPPNMAGRILRAHAAGRIAGDVSSIPLALPVEPPVAAPPLVAAAAPVAWVSPNGRARRRPATTFSQQWAGMAVAACVLVAGVGVALLALNTTGPLSDGDNTAHIESPPAAAPTASPAARDRHERTIVRRAAPLENPFDHAPFGAEDLAAAPAPGVPWEVPYAIEPQQTAKIVAFVDEQLADNWRTAGIEPAPPIDDAAWAERVAQQLLGREPSATELQALAADRLPDKRAAFVQRLLYDDSRRGEFARHWAKVWAQELIDAGAPPAQREGLEYYLAAALAADKPFSQITHELLTATGSNDPQAADFNGAVNFVLSGARGQREQIAGTVGRVFLGHQGQCAQCHDAAGGSGLSQQQFWQLAAFFQQARPLRSADGATRLVDADYVGPTGDLAEAEIFYDRPDRQRKIAYPVFVDGQAISPSGRVAEVNRRAELARLVVASEAFSQAAVSQWWKHLLGRRLAPADAAERDDNRDAELQRRLAEQFAAHGFDQKRLVEWIVLSEANAREPARDIDLRHVAGAPLFERFYGEETRSAPYESFAAALDAAQRGARPIDRDQRTLLARLAPTRPGGDGDASIIVRSAASLRRLDPSEYTLVDRLIASDMTYADKVQHLFLAGTGRAPSPAELQAAQETLARYEGSVAGALEELSWAIENSSEHRPLD